uniref:uncharacterized protein LOC123991635 n=1 Tax=Oncorhynchus gorbuscha TaxID=8017 RepID=UPI001EAF2FF2|nr:uncharacterized protein LOC123991635 [Oncorhynchus gorbuscha]
MDVPQLGPIQDWIALQRTHERLIMEAGQLAEPTSTDDMINPNYLLAGGSYGAYQFSNTCVIDSILAGIHVLAKMYPQIRDLFTRDNKINAVIRFLDFAKVNEAKALWLINLSLRKGKNLMQNAFVDIRGYVRDHLSNFIELVCASFDYDDSQSSSTPCDTVLNNILRKFEDYGEVKPLGTSRHEPKLILVDIDDRMCILPPLSITDDYERTYELQFLLMGQSTPLSNHMVLFLSTQLTGRWMIYDNMKAPLVQDIGVSELQRATERDKYVSYLAAYVKKE